MALGDNGNVWAEAARANGLAFSSGGGETPDLVGKKGGSRVIVQNAFAEKGEAESGGRLGYWYPCISLYFAEPLLVELAIRDMDIVSSDPQRAAALFGARDPSGSSPKERIAAMLAAETPPGKRVIRGDDERITCELHPTWGNVLRGHHSLSGTGIAWALSALAPIVDAVDAAHAKLGAPSWIASTRKRWRALAERRDMTLDGTKLLMQSATMTCEVTSGTRRTSTITARLPKTKRNPFKLSGVPARGPWAHRFASFFGSNIPSTGDELFDRRFDAEGDVPPALLASDTREALVLLHRETGGRVSVTREGLAATIDGIPDDEELESLLDAAESIVDGLKPRASR